MSKNIDKLIDDVLGEMDSPINSQKEPEKLVSLGFQVAESKKLKYERIQGLTRNKFGKELKRVVMMLIDKKDEQLSQGLA